MVNFQWLVQECMLVSVKEIRLFAVFIVIPDFDYFICGM